MSRLDTEGALKKLGDNQALYRKILERFVVTYEHTSMELQGLIAAEELQEAERLAHSIKGIAGNIGAQDLMELSGKLEILCRDKHDLAACSGVLDDFAKELRLVMAECRQVSVRLM